MWKKILVASGSALLLAPAAHAATIVHADSFAIAIPGSDTLTFLQFDPGLGTLTKVTVTLDAETHGGTIAWDNENPASSTDITLGIGAEVTASGLAGITATATPLQTASATDIDADNDGAADFLGTDAFSVVGGAGTDSDTAMGTSDLGPYIGGGLFTLGVSASTETFLSTTGGFGPIDPVPGVTTGTVTLTYEYTPIPEPGTAPLLALGLLGAATASRRGARR